MFLDYANPWPVMFSWSVWRVEMVIPTMETDAEYTW